MVVSRGPPLIRSSFSSLGREMGAATQSPRGERRERPSCSHLPKSFGVMSGLLCARSEAGTARAHATASAAVEIERFMRWSSAGRLWRVREDKTRLSVRHQPGAKRPAGRDEPPASYRRLQYCSRTRVGRLALRDGLE